MLKSLQRFALGLQHRHVPARLGISVFVLIPFLLHAGGWHSFGILTELETYAYDARVRLTVPGGRDPRIVIVDLDERSLATEGHWPWPRDKMARLVDELFDTYAIRLLGFDVVFSESDDTTVLAVVDELLSDASLPESTRTGLQRRRSELETDRIFAESLIARDVVLGFAFRYVVEANEHAQTGTLPKPLRRSEELGEINLAFPKAIGYVAPLPVLAAEALSAGFLNKPLIDADGVTRRAAMISVYNGDLYPSLGLAMALQVLGQPPLQFVFADSEGTLGGLQIEALKLGEVTIPIDHQAAMLVPYRGPAHSFPSVSATDVLQGNAEAQVLENVFVLFGSSAAGLLDLHVTPVGSAYPGVEVHANIIAGLIDGIARHRPDWARGVELFSLLLIGLLVALALPRLSPAKQLLLLLALAATVVAINLYYWQARSFVVPVAATLIYLFVAALLQLNYGFFIESFNKRRLSRLFGQYIPPEIVDEMDESGREISVEGESREMSVLFSDVRGFTTISEGMQPRELTRFMNAFLTPITEIIHRHRGTIDKYMGDAVMAFWGAPLDDTEHARNAVEAGLEMIERMHGLRKEFEKIGWPAVQIGVGVNTGIMNVGNMGSKFRLAYTVLGDAVNLGSRLEGQTKSYHVDFIVSETTCAKMPDYAFRELDRVRVKGKNEPVAIFEPIGPRSGLSEALRIRLSRYQLALMLYHAQKWELAANEFRALDDEEGHPACGIYLERIAHFVANPPGDDWDGVYTLTSK